MSMSHDLSGRKLGQYELRERLGRGGMADVYRAFQPGLERFVAVKVMLDRLAADEEFVERFRREARAVGQLRHAHIVNVFDFGIDDDAYYMVMEFIKGDNLKAHIARHPQGMAFDDALRITSQMADALDYAHKAGMIHRDVKPANIMFVDDTLQHAILTDFGIAYILSQPGLTASGAMVGTPAYLSPEIAAGHTADERADLYGLGIILYEMLTGRVPYEADTPLAVIMKHVNSPLPLPSEFGRDLPDSVEWIILKSLAKDPDDRYQTAAEMKTALDRARAQLAEGVPVETDEDENEQTEKVVVDHAVTQPVSAQEETRPSPPPPAGRSPLVWVGLVAALVIVAVAAFLLLRGGGGSPPAEPTMTEMPTQAALAATIGEPTHTPTEEATLAPTATVTEPPPTSTATEEPTLAPTEAPTTAPSPAPTEVAAAPEAMTRLRQDGLLSGLTPLQDEIDTLILTDHADEAEAQLNQMLQAEPDNIDALVARALLRTITGDANAAKADADKVVELAPDSPLGYIARSDVLQHWAIDDAEGSLAAAKQALALDPNNPEALWRASMNYAELNNEDAFLKTLGQAEAQGAKGFRFIDFAGEYLYYDNQFERALPYLQKRITINPQDMYSLRLLAMDLLRLDRPADAYAAVKNYPGVFSEPGDLSAAAYVAYSAGDYEQARSWAETARALSGDAYAATWVLALVSWDADHDLQASMNYFDQIEGAEFYDDFLSIDFGHERHLDRARVLVEAGEPEAALGALQQGLDVLGPNPGVLEAMANVQLALGQTEAARESLRQALENVGDNPDEQQRLLNRIRDLGAAGGLNRAPISPLSGLTPLQDEIDNLILQGQWDEASNRLNTMLQAEPNNVDALIARSLLRSLGGMGRLAQRDADRAVELAPDSPLGYVARSEALDRLGDPQGMLAAAEEALKLAPDYPAALWRASLAQAALGHFDAHIELLNRAIDAGAQGFRFANFAGQYLYYANDYERAEPYLELWNRVMPGSIDSTAFLAANLVQLGRVDDAYQIIRSYPGQEWNDVPDSRGWAAYIAYRAGDIDQARRWAEAALARNPDQANAHYVLGLISWYADGDLKAALQHLDVVSQVRNFGDPLLDPSKGHQIDYDRGRILAAAGDLDGAIASYQRGLKRDPRPYMAEALADAYLAQEKPELAVESLHRAMDMTENPDERSRLLQRIRELGG